MKAAAFYCKMSLMIKVTPTALMPPLSWMIDLRYCTPLLLAK